MTAIRNQLEKRKPSKTKINFNKFNKLLFPFHLAWRPDNLRVALANDSFCKMAPLARDKLDRSMPLYNNTNSVRWIELEKHQQSHPQSPLGPAHHQPQTTAAAPTNNKVNENCFINIYNNSVGVSEYVPLFLVVPPISSSRGETRCFRDEEKVT